MIVKSKDTLRAFLSSQKSIGKTTGFIPTMGALHQGHLSLVERANAECDIVIVSIFVNPTQFNDSKDLDQYPRDLDADVKLLKSFVPESIVFAPSAIELYNGHITAKKFDFGTLGKFMEGKSRPGHFNGMATVVSLLFDCVSAERAYFGEKDFQQLRIIEKLTLNQNRRITIVPCPIARDKCGLALSSRNKQLSYKNQERASLLFNVLKQSRNAFDIETIEQIRKNVVKVFSEQDNLKLEYFEIADITTLKPTLKKESGKKYRAFIAASLDGIRLIDNLELN